MAWTDFLQNVTNTVKTGADAFSTVKGVVEPPKQAPPSVTTPGGASTPVVGGGGNQEILIFMGIAAIVLIFALKG